MDRWGSVRLFRLDALRRAPAIDGGSYATQRTGDSLTDQQGRPGATPAEVLKRHFFSAMGTDWLVPDRRSCDVPSPQSCVSAFHAAALLISLY